MQPDNGLEIEERMQNMKRFYLKLGEIIENFPDTIPSDMKALLKEKILGDNELKKLMDGVDTHRPPRIFMIGRTGVGKSNFPIFGMQQSIFIDNMSILKNTCTVWL